MADPSVVDALNTLRAELQFIEVGVWPGEIEMTRESMINAARRAGSSLAVVETALADQERREDAIHEARDKELQEEYVLRSTHAAIVGREHARAVAAEAERDALRQALERIDRRLTTADGKNTTESYAAALLVHQIARAVLADEEPT